MTATKCLIGDFVAGDAPPAAADADDDAASGEAAAETKMAASNSLADLTAAPRRS
jgi:hypothetical protein